MSVTEHANTGLAACHNKSQNHKSGTGVKAEVYWGAATWDSGRLPSQRPSSLPTQAHSPYRDRRRGLRASPRPHLIILLAFSNPDACPFIFLAFGMLGPCLFLFLAFGTLGVRTCPCSHLGQWGEMPLIPDCLQKHIYDRITPGGFLLPLFMLFSIFLSSLLSPPLCFPPLPGISRLF